MTSLPDGLLGDLQVRPLAERVAEGRLEVDGLRRELRPIHRIQRDAPVGILRAGDDETLQHELRRAHGLLGSGEVLARGRGLRLRLHDVDRRHGPHFDARLIVLNQLHREIDRLLRDVDRLDGEDVVPVRVAHVRQRIGDGRPQLNVGDVPIQLRDRELLTRRVDREVAQNRLVVGKRPRRLKERVEQRVVARAAAPKIVQRCREVASAPWQALRDSAVERHCLRNRRATAAKLRLTRGQNRGGLRADRRRQRRVVHRLHAQHGDVIDLRVEALDRDVEVAVEGELHRLVKGEPQRWPGLAGRPRRLLRVEIAARDALGRLGHQLAKTCVGHLLGQPGRRKCREYKRGSEGPHRSVPCHCLSP